MDEVEAPPPLPVPAEPAPAPPAVMLAAGAAAPPEDELPAVARARKEIATLLAAERTDAWALSVCRLLEYLEQQPDLVASSEQLIAEEEQLIQAAYDDCSFCHCYLSVAEDARWALVGIKKKMAATASRCGGCF